MISSQLSKQLHEALTKLRACTEPTQDMDSVNYHTKYNSECTEDLDHELDHPDQLTFDYESLSHQTWPDVQDMCYAKSGSYKKFYQDIADAAKSWTDKPSDRKKISQAIEYVLETAKTAPLVNNTLNNKLRHDEMMRIVSKLVSYLNSN